MGARNCTKRAPIGRKRDGEEGPGHESANLLEPDARIGRPGVGIGPRPHRLPLLLLTPHAARAAQVSGGEEKDDAALPSPVAARPNLPRPA